jgi:hypothetical protein
MVFPTKYIDNMKKKEKRGGIMRVIVGSESPENK